MNSSPYHLDAAWRARSESPAELAARLAKMLRDLARLHPAFGRWNKLGDTREEANEPFCTMPPQAHELTDIFERHRTDDDLAAAWNGLESASGISFSVNAGEGAVRTLLFTNRLEIIFHAQSSDNADLVNYRVFASAMRAVAAAWEPDWARIYPWNLELEPKRRYTPVSGGWLVLLGPEFASKITLPPGIAIENLPGGGVLMSATTDPFDKADPVHMAAAQAINASLKPLLDLADSLL